MRQTQQNIIKSLPPGLEQSSFFEFGTFIIQLNIEQLQQLNVTSFSLKLMGGHSQEFNCNRENKCLKFSIKTTLWHFYNYLKDMGQIQLELNTNEEILKCVKGIQLLSVGKVMSRSYLKGNYIANSVELCDIFDQKGSNKGYAMFKAKVQFDEEMHAQIVEIVDFQALMNNPEETGKRQFIEVAKIKENTNKIDKNDQDSKTFQSINQKRNQQNLPNYYNIQGLSQQNPFNNNIGNKLGIQQVQSINQNHRIQNAQQQSRMLEDDIDRMIAEMQNKPYDSSRYLDGNSNPPNLAKSSNKLDDSNNSHGFIPLNSYNQSNTISQNSFAQSSHGVNQQENRQNRFYQPQTQMTDKHLKHSHSKSPINMHKYPRLPIPSSNRSLHESQQLNSTIYAQSQRSLSPLNRSNNRSLNKTQQTISNRSIKNISMAGSQLFNRGNEGILKIHCHQLLGTDVQNDQDCHLILRVYLNDQVDDVFQSKGVQQGQVIIYNQKTQLQSIVLSQLQKLRFQLENYQGQVVYSAMFEMARLIQIPRLEGIFMLNMHSHQNGYYGPNVTVSQTMLKKLPQPPSQKSLRISLSFTEQIQVMQIYLQMSQFSLNYSKCKYKIPFTKETVEFDPTSTHCNIFPHSKQFSKLVIEFWSESSILGVAEINLSNLKSITKNVLECNVEPIYLYDCLFPVKNLITQNQLGKFKLMVCCGNVRQVQHMLNKSMLSKTQSLKQSSVSNKNLVQVEYDKKLGVYIKDAKVRQQIQIQVDQNQIQTTLQNHQKQTLSGKNKYSRANSQVQSKTDKNQPQDYHQTSMMSQNQFLASQDNNKQLQLSKVHSIKLNQQEEIDSDQQRQKVFDFKNKSKGNTIQEPMKPSKSVIEQFKATTLVQTKQSIVALPQPKKPQSQPLKPLTGIICSYIQSTFYVLTDNDLSAFQELKKLCKPSLLFNFIDIDVFVKHLMEISVSKNNIIKILQILQPLNGMVNFNLLNDFMISIQVQNQVKDNLIPNKLFVKLALEQYYRVSCQQFEQSQALHYKDWLSSACLSQISTLDESIDFNEARKLFSLLGIKLSMNEYNLLKAFLQSETQIKSFLLNITESKSAYQTLIKSQKNIYQILKLSLVEDIVRKKTEENINRKYEQNILDRLYSSKMYQTNEMNQSLESSKISNQDNQLSFAFQTQANPRFITKTDQNQQLKPNHWNNTIKTSLSNTSQKQSNQLNRYQQQDDDDFIINGLNSKPSQIQKNISHSKINEKQITKQSESSQDEGEQVETTRFKQSVPQIKLSKSGQQQINFAQKRTIVVFGLQSCKSTYQCQLDQQLQCPFFKIIIESPYEKKLYFKESDQGLQQTFQVRGNYLNSDDEEIQGQVVLVDVTSKGQKDIALARFVVIRGIKSVYAIKTIQEESFCGLVNIIIQ